MTRCGMWKDLDYRTSVEGNMLIMQAIERELFLQEFEKMAPMIRQYLEDHGVVFP